MRRGEFTMGQAKKGSGLSPERVERIKAAQKRHAAIDPACVNLTPEEFINWHPVGGMSWEECARRMKEAGLGIRICLKGTKTQSRNFPILPKFHAEAQRTQSTLREERKRKEKTTEDAEFHGGR